MPLENQTCARSRPRHGALVLSLDFELHWGVRDHCPPHGRYRDNLLGARMAIPRILDMFEKYEIAATWAVVGFLYGSSGEDLRRFWPKARPAYQNADLDPYQETVGDSENEDPLHLAPSLIGRIRSTPRQEIATHTFSHYYCLEDGSARETFAADLASAVSIAGRSGDRLRSIVFPKNQVAYLDLLPQTGISSYRGNERWLNFSSLPPRGQLLWLRARRFLDNYINLTGHNLGDWRELTRESGVCNVPSSRFLRPYSPLLRPIEPARFRRIAQSMMVAAGSGKIYHLWWHPHNFGKHLERNLEILASILDVFQRCRARYSMQSLTMAEVTEAAREFNACTACADVPAGP